MNRHQEITVTLEIKDFKHLNLHRINTCGFKKNMNKKQWMPLFLFPFTMKRCFFFFKCSLSRTPIIIKSKCLPLGMSGSQKENYSQEEVWLWKKTLHRREIVKFLKDIIAVALLHWAKYYVCALQVLHLLILTHIHSQR